MVVNKGKLAPQILTSQEIVVWYDDIYASIDWFFSKGNPHYTSYFVGYSDDEVSERRNAHLLELDTTSAFITLATIEALLVVDYQVRVRKRRLKDPLSKYFRQHDHLFTGHITLNDRILDAWQIHYPELKKDINILKSAMQYRHWLAHGRHWFPKFPKHQYDFKSVYLMAVSIGNDFPLV